MFSILPPFIMIILAYNSITTEASKFELLISKLSIWQHKISSDVLIV